MVKKALLSLAKAALISGAAYLFSFIFVPYVILSFANEIVAIAAVVASAVILAAGAAVWELKPRWLWLSIPLMWALIMAYCPEGLYGIESGGNLDFFPASLDAAAFSLAYGAGMVAAATVVSLIKKLISKK